MNCGGTGRVLILGGSGLLGRAMLRHIPGGVEVDAPAEDDLRLEDLAGIERRLSERPVDAVLLLAAWTNVDACESDPERAFLINGILPGRIAALAERFGTELTFLSTDYIFDGMAGRPYREYDPANPLGVYARSKWYGECSVRGATRRSRTVRATGLFGQGGPDFVSAVLQRMVTGPVDVVTDEICSPTYVDHLAGPLWRIVTGDCRGIWHLAAPGEVSRFEMALRIADLAGVDRGTVRPTTLRALGRPAPRPARAILDCQAARDALGISLPSWNEGLDAYWMDVHPGGVSGGGVRRGDAAGTAGGDA